jgi:hypothetical protein
MISSFVGTAISSIPLYVSDMISFIMIVKSAADISILKIFFGGRKRWGARSPPPHGPFTSLFTCQ